MVIEPGAMVAAGLVFVAAATTVLALDPFFGITVAAAAASLAAWVMLFGSAIVGIVTVGELFGSHPTTNAEAAFHHMTKGAYAPQWWRGQLLLVVVPIVAGALVVSGGNVITGAIGGIAAMVGVFLADDAFVKAGQSVPLS